AVAARAAHRIATRPPSFDEAVAAVMADGDRLTTALLRGTLDPETRARLRLDADGAAVPYEAGPAAMAPDIETLLHLRSLDLFAHLTPEQLAGLAPIARDGTSPPATTTL